jgi:predicted  nucleic acid-binding Zn-ribbon protein
MQNEIVHLISQKDDIENDLSSSNLQKNILHNDLENLSHEHDTLKGAYKAMEIEFKNLQNKYKRNDIIESELKQANDKISDLKGELALSFKKIMDLEKGADLVIQLTAKIATVQENNCILETQLKQANQSIEMYQKNIENLKKRIKELGNGNGDNKDFMDTFEEVMREEMTAMKSAFETKLKIAKEEVEVMARRHQQAIKNLQTLSPSNSKTYLNVPKGASLI